MIKQSMADESQKRPTTLCVRMCVYANIQIDIIWRLMSYISLRFHRINWVARHFFPTRSEQIEFLNCVSQLQIVSMYYILHFHLDAPRKFNPFTNIKCSVSLSPFYFTTFVSSVGRQKKKILFIFRPKRTIETMNIETAE